jgi:spermidine/putrescine transport system substrate-binding protein
MNERFDRAAFERVMRALAERRISRRQALKYAGMGAGSLSLAALLAACGVEGAQTPPSPTGTMASPSPLAPLPPKAGELDVANWPLYIDTGRQGTVNRFREASGIDIRYEDVISDNDEFFGTDIQPQLDSDQPTDWDVIVMTDWMIAKLSRLGWLEPLHSDALPNCTANVDEKFRDVWYDRGHAYSYPWAAGVTGIGYNKKLTGRAITSINDLLDPAFKGKVGMFSEMRDTVNFALLIDGIDPTTATVDQVEQSTQKLYQQRDDGIVRAYYGNDYIDPLAGGDLVLTMAWSGDVNFLKLDNPDLEFVVPAEGGNRWTDNMCIPLRAAHPTDAHEWMNFVYDVENATAITEYVWYESPVAGVRELIREHAADDESLLAVSESTIVWPDSALLANLYPYKDLSFEEEEAWHDIFDPLIQG